MLDPAGTLDGLDEDGSPVSRYAAGDPLPGGLRACERLGVGHRCETWLAWSSELCSPAVVKFPRPHQLDHPRARQSLCREVAALAGNLHPGLARLYDDGTAAATPYLVFEYIDGTALDDEIDEHGAFDPADVAMIAVQLLAAARTVHARGVAHIDVKPENVMLRDGRPVLLDFGSARVIGARQPRGSLIGSPGYAAPELEAGEPISAAMDLYGIGVTLYESLAGEVAFEPESAAADRPVVAAPPESEVADLVLGLMDPDPTARPEIGTALRAFGGAAAAAGRAPWPQWARP